MMKTIIFVSIISCTLAGRLGWSQEVLDLSLEEALTMAIKNSPEIQVQNINQQISQKADEKVDARRLPKISAAGDFRLNTQLQSTVLPFDITGQNPEGTSTVRFGTRFQNTLNLQLEQPIYHPENKIQRAINANRMADENEHLKEIEQSVKKKITESYYSTIYSREKIDIAEKELKAAEFILSTGNTQYQKGTIRENELLKLKVTVANAQLTLERAQNDYSTNLTELKKQLYLDRQMVINPSDSISELENRIQDRALQTSSVQASLRRMELDESYAELRSELIMAERRVSLDAYAQYGLLQLNDQFNPVDFNSWYPYNYLGIQIGVPIFDGKLSKLKAQDELLERKKSQLQLVQLKRDLKEEEIQARKELAFSQRALELARENLELAETIYSNDQLRFEKGTLLPADLRQSELEITRSRDSYLDAIYAFLVADLELRDVLGDF
ncbi:MAG: TolC family protein [Saprospiraceae bacterium]|nr:TolC family protein [Saprospiraceae bacterium]